MNVGAIIMLAGACALAFGIGIYFELAGRKQTLAHS